MLWHRERHINPQRTDKLSWTRRGSNSWPPNWGNSASCQLSSTFASCHWNCVKKHNSNDMPEAALDNWQPVWNAQVSISTPVCVNFELRPGAGDICICWFDFDALAQENATFRKWIKSDRCIIVATNNMSPDAYTRRYCHYMDVIMSAMTS